MNKRATPIREDSASVPVAREVTPPALLFEMLRSFVALAKTLNLSHAVKELSSTRQTLRRHISLLEEYKGGLLFDVKDRRYALSPLGEHILPEALDLLASATAWLSGQSTLVNGLQYLTRHFDDGRYFYQQQHQLDKAFLSSSPMLKEVIAGWSASGGQLDHEAFQKVRPYCNVFRRVNNDLVFSEVGEKSSFVSWYGGPVARSTIGRSIGAMPGGGDFARLVDIAYSEIEIGQSIRLDHIHAIIPKFEAAEPVSISYERLLIGARFPDQSPAIVSVVRRTYDIEINEVSPEMVRRMPEDTVMQ